MHQVSNEIEHIQYAETRLEPIWDCLVSILKNPDTVIPKLEEYTFKHSNGKTLAKKIKEIEEQTVTLGNQMKRLSTVFIDGQIIERDYRKRMSDINHRIAELKKEKQRYQQMIVKRSDQEDRDEILKELYEKIKTRLENATYEDKQYIIQLFIERINLFHRSNYAEVYFKFPNSTPIQEVEGLSKISQPDVRLVLHVKTLNNSERIKAMFNENPNICKGRQISA